MTRFQGTTVDTLASGSAVPPTMTVEVAASYLGISRTTAYAEAQRYRDTGGKAGLPNIKLGGRVLVLTALLGDLLGGTPHDISRPGL